MVGWLVGWWLVGGWLMVGWRLLRKSCPHRPVSAVVAFDRQLHSPAHEGTHASAHPRVPQQRPQHVPAVHLPVSVMSRSSIRHASTYVMPQHTSCFNIRHASTYVMRLFQHEFHSEISCLKEGRKMTDVLSVVDRGGKGGCM